MFSWKQAKINALNTKLRRAKHQSKNKTNSQYNIDHPNETRAAQQNDFKELEKRLKDDFQRHLDRRQKRRETLT